MLPSGIYGTGISRSLGLGAVFRRHMAASRRLAWLLYERGCRRFHAVARRHIVASRANISPRHAGRAQLKIYFQRRCFRVFGMLS